MTRQHIALLVVSGLAALASPFAQQCDGQMPRLVTIQSGPGIRALPLQDLWYPTDGLMQFDSLPFYMPCEGSASFDIALDFEGDDGPKAEEYPQRFIREERAVTQVAYKCVISGQPIGGNATLQAQETAPYLAVQDVEELSVDCRLDRNEQLLEYTVPEGMEWVIWPKSGNPMKRTGISQFWTHTAYQPQGTDQPGSHLLKDGKVIAHCITMGIIPVHQQPRITFSDQAPFVHVAGIEMSADLPSSNALWQVICRAVKPAGGRKACSRRSRR